MCFVSTPSSIQTKVNNKYIEVITTRSLRIVEVAITCNHISQCIKIFLHDSFVLEQKKQ